MSQVLALAYEPDREVRQRAHETLYSVLSRPGTVLTFVYDTLVQDQLTMDRLRKYPTPMTERHLGNEVPASGRGQMMEVEDANYGIAQRVLRPQGAAARARAG